MTSFGDPLRVVLIDDHQLFREGMRGVLEADGRAVVGEGADGQEAVALARDLQPDVLVLDLRMGAFSGLDALRGVSNSNPDIHAVVVTVSAERGDVLDALAAGASGYLL